MDTNREIIKEKDEKIAELESLLKELTEGQQQSAATIAVDYNPRSLSTPKEKFKFPLKASGLMIWAILSFLVIAVGGFWLFQGNTLKKESVMYVERIQALSTLATAVAHTKVILTEEDHKILGNDTPLGLDLPGTKRQILLVVPGTVIYGVDLKKITSKDMVINEETKEINITLPHAEVIGEPSVQMDKLQKIDDSGLLSGGVKSDEWDHLVAKAQKLMSQEATSEGLPATAEKNAEIALTNFFKNAGYTVNVTFN